MKRSSLQDLRLQTSHLTTGHNSTMKLVLNVTPPSTFQPNERTCPYPSRHRSCQRIFEQCQAPNDFHLLFHTTLQFMLNNKHNRVGLEQHQPNRFSIEYLSGRRRSKQAALYAKSTNGSIVEFYRGYNTCISRDSLLQIWGFKCTTEDQRSAARGKADQL